MNLFMRGRHMIGQRIGMTLAKTVALGLIVGLIALAGLSLPRFLGEHSSSAFALDDAVRRAVSKIPLNVAWESLKPETVTSGIYNYQMTYRAAPTATTATRDANLVTKTIANVLQAAGHNPKMELPIISVTALQNLGSGDHTATSDLGTAFYDPAIDAVRWSPPNRN